MGITGMVTSITDVLNVWNDMGVFSYVIPFLLIFAVVFAILDKTKMLSKDGENRGIIAIIAVAIALLSLQFDFVSVFFANIFPKFGIGLSLFLVVLIFLGFFNPEDKDGKWGGAVSWIGWVVGVGVFLWALTSWDEWGYYGLGGWFSENIWAILILGAIIAVIAVVAKSKKDS